MYAASGILILCRWPSCALAKGRLVYMPMWWPAVAKAEFPLSLGNGRSPHGYINQRLQKQFRAPDDERCAARNTLSLQKNFGIIKSITELHRVGISTENTLHVSDGLPSIIRSLRLYIQHRYMSYRFCGCMLASSQLTCMVWCCMYSLRLLMMDGKTVRNM